MSAVNLYKPPQNWSRDYLLGERPEAYRDGECFIAKQGYVGPKICAVTGEDVQGGDYQVKVSFKPRSSFREFFTFRTIIMIISNGMLAPLLLTFDRNYLVIVPYLITHLTVGVYYRMSAPSIKLFYNRELYLKRKRNQITSIVFIYVAYYLMLLALLEIQHVYIAFIAVLLGLIAFKVRVKPLLKSSIIDDDYEQFEGAHINFLKMLPCRDEFEAVELEEKV